MTHNGAIYGYVHPEVINGVRIYKHPDTVKVVRPWRERLFTRPWRPWQRWKWVRNPAFKSGKALRIGNADGKGQVVEAACQGRGLDHQFEFGLRGEHCLKQASDQFGVTDRETAHSLRL